jgi:DNA-binding MarR family transcriptional regulator
MDIINMNRNEDIANELLVKIFNDILEIEEKVLRKGEFSDLSVREMHVIESIGKKDQSMMSEVAQDLGITVGTLTTAINKLIKKGYVIRKRIEEDRRVVMVQLTDKGIAAKENHKGFHNEMISSMMLNHTEEEKEILTHSLEKLNKYFNEKYELVKK